MFLLNISALLRQWCQFSITHLGQWWSFLCIKHKRILVFHNAKHLHPSPKPSGSQSYWQRQRSAMLPPRCTTMALDFHTKFPHSYSFFCSLAICSIWLIRSLPRVELLWEMRIDVASEKLMRSPPSCDYRTEAEGRDAGKRASDAFTCASFPLLCPPADQHTLWPPLELCLLWALSSNWLASN